MKEKTKQGKKEEELKLRLFERARELDNSIEIPKDPHDPKQRARYIEQSKQYGDLRSAFMRVIRDLGLFVEYVEFDALYEPEHRA